MFLHLSMCLKFLSEIFTVKKVYQRIKVISNKIFFEICKKIEKIK